MLTTLTILLVIAILWALAYHRAKLWMWTAVIAVMLLLHTHFVLSASHYSAFGALKVTIEWIIFLIIAIPLNILQLRRKLFSARALTIYRRILPKMSRTEKEALEAGTVTWEGELFRGAPRWNQLLKMPQPQLTADELAFLEGPVEELCSMLNDWDITHVRTDLPPEVWQFLKENGFFAFIIPKQYGGKQFSTLAQSAVLIKIYSVSVTAASTVGVPNSLGPAELLLHYGTEEQKNYYLPRLAKGEEIPCFALTGPEAGSDAGSIPDTGIVCKGEFQGKEIIGIRLNWNKRYITLAPIATLLGLAFKLYDPDHLIGDQIERGITCALIPTSTPGVKIGRRHFPLNIAFLNGPTQGENVFIPVDWIIGGPSMAGQGWRMLVECLSAGRAITLPSSALAGGKAAAMVTGGYAYIRKQFGISIGRFEGVAEALTRIAAYTYLIDASLKMTLGIIDQGEKPSILSAIMKYHATELARKIACDAMDVHGGKGICLGPRNYLGRGYQSIPISITVEGANILTRNMIIFGQGAIRCHPYILAEMTAAQEVDPKLSLQQFDKALFSHMGYTFSNLMRSLFLGITNGLFVFAPRRSPVKRFYQKLSRMSSAFALMSDFSMLLLGGELKRKERLSARLGDILSELYLISGVLKYFEDQGQPYVDLPIVQWLCQNSLWKMQQTLHTLLRNFPNKTIALLLRIFIFPLGRCYAEPNDQLSQQVANILLEPSSARDRLIMGIYKTPSEFNPAGRVEDTFYKLIAVESLQAKIIRAQRQGDINGDDYAELVQAAHKANIITQDEMQQLLTAEAARKDVIAVDDFAHEELARPAAN